MSLELVGYAASFFAFESAANVAANASAKSRLVANAPPSARGGVAGGADVGGLLAAKIVWNICTTSGSTSRTSATFAHWDCLRRMGC